MPRVGRHGWHSGQLGDVSDRYCENSFARAGQVGGWRAVAVQGRVSTSQKRAISLNVFGGFCWLFVRVFFCSFCFCFCFVCDIFVSECGFCSANERRPKKPLCRRHHIGFIAPSAQSVHVARTHAADNGATRGSSFVVPWFASAAHRHCAGKGETLAPGVDAAALINFVSFRRSSCR